MTDQERIPKLRDGTWDHTIMRGPNPTGFCSDETLFVQDTADRIEELEARNKDLALQVISTAGQAADALDKLTKALETLREFAKQKRISEMDVDEYDQADIEGAYCQFIFKARAVLDELEGKE